jgi:hypothetical protein
VALFATSVLPHFDVAPVPADHPAIKAVGHQGRSNRTDFSCILKV